MANRVLATDLDGTLFYPKRHFTMISRKNVAFLKRWIADGNRVVLVSSRSPYFAKKIFERYGFPFDFVGLDGTYVRVGDQVILNEVFEPKSARALFTEIQTKYNPALTMAASLDYPMLQPKHPSVIWGTLAYRLYMMVQGIYKEPFVRSDEKFYGELDNKKMNKIMFCIGLSAKKKKLAYQLTSSLQKEHPDFKFFWLNQFIEITPKGCDKASGLAFYLDYLKISHENVVVVGDSGNDVSMFDRFHEFSYCMSHSPKEVQVHAKHVIDKVADLEAILYPSVDSKPNPSDK